MCAHPLSAYAHLHRQQHQQRLAPAAVVAMPGWPTLVSFSSMRLHCSGLPGRVSLPGNGDWQQLA